MTPEEEDNMIWNVNILYALKSDMQMLSLMRTVYYPCTLLSSPPKVANQS